MRWGVVALALLAPALAGCVTIATVSVDGQRAATYVVPLGGVAISRGHADAVSVKQVSLGLWRTGPAFGVGIASASLIEADPHSDIAILNGRVLGRLSLPSTRRTSDDTPIRTAGGDPS